MHPGEYTGTSTFRFSIRVFWRCKGSHCGGPLHCWLQCRSHHHCRRVLLSLKAPIIDLVWRKCLCPSMPWAEFPKIQCRRRAYAFEFLITMGRNKISQLTWWTRAVRRTLSWDSFKRFGSHDCARYLKSRYQNMKVNLSVSYKEDQETRLETYRLDSDWAYVSKHFLMKVSFFPPITTPLYSPHSTSLWKIFKQIFQSSLFSFADTDFEKSGRKLAIPAPSSIFRMIWSCCGVASLCPGPFTNGKQGSRGSVWVLVEGSPDKLIVSSHAGVGSLHPSLSPSRVSTWNRIRSWIKVKTWIRLLDLTRIFAVHCVIYQPSTYSCSAPASLWFRTAMISRRSC